MDQLRPSYAARPLRSGSSPRDHDREVRHPANGNPTRRPPTGRAFVRILVVSNDPATAESITHALARGQSFLCRCDTAPDIEVALRAVATAQYDVGIVEAEPGEAAPALAKLGQLAAGPAPVPLLLLIDRAEDWLEQEALDRGAMDLVDRSDLEPSRLERALRLAIHRKRAAIRLDRLAQLDGLTGLGNRSLLQDRLEHALANARRLRTLVAVMMLDLNGFKAVNDALGHAAGDELLRAIAERLKSRLRVSDTIARVGGDEFALVIENLQRPEQADMIARKLLNTIAPAFTIEGRPVQVTGSLGVAIYPDHAESGLRLLKLADAAMYAAKARGGNLSLLHGAELAVEPAASTSRAADLRRAMEQGEIVLMFEPQAPLGSERLGIGTGLRWKHPEYGLLETDAIGGLAESAGLAEPLAFWLANAVCAQARAWQKTTNKPFQVSLPVLSRRQVAWAELATRVSDELQRHGLPRAALELELDERLLAEELDAGGAAVAAKRAAGARLAVHGFTAGAASLRILRDVPVCTVRLAPELLHDVPGDERRARFTRAIIHLAHELRCRVVADGVETREQMAFLRAEHCDAVTGPTSTTLLSAEGCAAWLRERAPMPARFSARA